MTTPRPRAVYELDATEACITGIGDRGYYVGSVPGCLPGTEDAVDLAIVTDGDCTVDLYCDGDAVSVSAEDAAELLRRVVRLTARWLEDAEMEWAS